MTKKPRSVNSLYHADMQILLAAFFLLLLFAVADVQTQLQEKRELHTTLWRVLLLALISVIAYLGGLLRGFRTGSNRIIRPILAVCFALYLYLLLSLTLFDAAMRLTGDRFPVSELSQREYYMEWFVNFRPFESIYNVYIRGLMNGYVSVRYTLLNLLGNLGAFMPFAFFLPCFCKQMKKWYVFLPTVLLCVAAVEGFQLLLMVGSCDVDDLILNTGGAFLLHLLLRIPPLRKFCDRVAEGRF